MESSDNMISLKLTEEEYISRLKLRLAMVDVLNAYKLDNDPVTLGKEIIDIIEGWEF